MTRVAKVVVGVIVVGAVLAIITLGGPIYDRLFLSHLDRASLARSQRASRAPASQLSRLDDERVVRRSSPVIEEECPVDSGDLLRQPGISMNWHTEPGQAADVAQRFKAYLLASGWASVAPLDAQDTGYLRFERREDDHEIAAYLYVADGSRIYAVVTDSSERPCRPGLLNSGANR